MAVLGLFQTYCTCSVEKSKFYNSTSSCSEGVVTFSSILAHASDDGSVTATVLIETFEVAVVAEDNPTITVDGQELAVSVPPDDASTSMTGLQFGLFFVGFFTATVIGVVTCLIVTG